jgi:hypothetical protein
MGTLIWRQRYPPHHQGIEDVLFNVLTIRGKMILVELWQPQNFNKNQLKNLLFGVNFQTLKRV